MSAPATRLRSEFPAFHAPQHIVSDRRSRRRYPNIVEQLKRPRIEHAILHRRPCQEGASNQIVGNIGTFFTRCSCTRAYTIALVAAAPVVNPNRPPREIPVREVEGLTLPPPHGCVFAPRCPPAVDQRYTEIPMLRPIVEGQFAACHLATPDGISETTEIGVRGAQHDH